MGLEDRNKGLGVTFVSITREGKFEIKVDSKTPGAFERDKKDGTKVWVKTHDTLSGFLTKVEYVKAKDSNNMGTRLKVTITDDKNYVIDMGFSAANDRIFSYPMHIVTKLLNIDLDKEVILAPYSFLPKDEKYKKEGITIYQDKMDKDHVVKSCIENFEDIPKGVKIEGVTEEDVKWSYTAQLKYFYAMLLEGIKKVKDYMEGKDLTPEPNITMKASPNDDPSKVVKFDEDDFPGDDENPNPVDEDDDDLPF